MIIRGTTPTLRYTFRVVDPASIVTAYLTLSQGCKAIEKNSGTMVSGENYIEWQLSQQETLALDPRKPCEIQLRYRTSDGKAYASLISREGVGNVTKGGEI